MKLVYSVLLLLLSTFVLAEPMPVENYFKNPDISGVSISPNGRYYAATVTLNNEKQLAILDSKTKELKQLFSFASEDREIGSFGWFNNERIYASMVVKVGPLDSARPTGYLFAGNVDGSKRIQLLPEPAKPGRSGDRPRGYSIFNRLKDDEKHILISMSEAGYQVIYKLNIYTGSKIKVDKSPYKYMRLISDRHGNVKGGIQSDPDNQKYIIHIRDLKTDKWEVFASVDEKKGGMSPIGFNADASTLYLEIENEEQKRGVYAFDVNKKSFDLVKAIQGDADIEQFIRVYDAENNFYELVGFRQMPGYVEDTFLDDKSSGAKFLKSLSQAFPGQVVDLVNSTEDGSKSLVRVWADTNPGTFFVFHHEKNELEYLLDTLPWIEREKLSPMEPIAFKARDGLEIRGYLTRPLGKKKDLPMVVYVHGGPYGPKDSWGYNYSNRDTQFLASRGFAVLQVNYRGSGGRGEDFQYGAYLKMGAEMQDDLTDATLWAVEQGIADKNRICIYGASYGGYAAMMGVVKEPDLYQCAIAYVGVYDIAIQTEESDTAQSEYGVRFLKEAWNAYDEKFVRERSPIYHLDKLKAGVFLVHGEDDPRVPIEQYEALAEALDKRNYPYKSNVQPLEGHGFRYEKNNYVLYKQIEDFLNQYIGKK